MKSEPLTYDYLGVAWVLMNEPERGLPGWRTVKTWDTYAGALDALHLIMMRCEVPCTEIVVEWDAQTLQPTRWAVYTSYLPGVTPLRKEEAQHEWRAGPW